MHASTRPRVVQELVDSLYLLSERRPSLRRGNPDLQGLQDLVGVAVAALVEGRPYMASAEHPPTPVEELEAAKLYAADEWGAGVGDS